MDRIGLQFTPLLIPIVGAAILLILLAVYGLRRSDAASGTGVFSSLLAVTAWWCITYALELITTDPTVMLLWVKLQWISISFLPVTWLMFALLYAGYSQRVNLRTAVLLSIIPAIMLVLVWTTPAHTLVYADPGVRDTGGFVAFNAERGPAFYAHLVYAYALVLLATVLMIRVWRKAAGTQRQLALVVATGALFPFAGNAIYQAALAADLPLYFDLTVPAFAISAVLFAWGWYRLHLFDLIGRFGQYL